MRSKMNGKRGMMWTAHFCFTFSLFSFWGFPCFSFHQVHSHFVSVCITGISNVSLCSQPPFDTLDILFGDFSSFFHRLLDVSALSSFSSSPFFWPIFHHSYSPLFAVHQHESRWERMKESVENREWLFMSWSSSSLSILFLIHSLSFSGRSSPRMICTAFYNFSRHISILFPFLSSRSQVHLLLPQRYHFSPIFPIHWIVHSVHFPFTQTSWSESPFLPSFPFISLSLNTSLFSHSHHPFSDHQMPQFYCLIVSLKRSMTKAKREGADEKRIWPRSESDKVWDRYFNTLRLLLLLGYKHNFQMRQERAKRSDKWYDFVPDKLRGRKYFFCSSICLFIGSRLTFLLQQLHIHGDTCCSCSCPLTGTRVTSSRRLLVPHFWWSSSPRHLVPSSISSWMLMILELQDTKERSFQRVMMIIKDGFNWEEEKKRFKSDLSGS